MGAARLEGCFPAEQLEKAAADLKGARSKRLIHPAALFIVIIGVSGCVKVSLDFYIVFFIVHGQGAVALPVGPVGIPGLDPVISRHGERAAVNDHRALGLQDIAVNGQ